MSATDETAPQRPSIGAKFTEDLVADMRARFGRKKPATRPWNTAATHDTINHYAQGIGDLNPLWTDPSYGASSVWGRQIAPPCWVYTLGQPFAGGMRGIHGLFGGSTFTWHRPVFAGDELTSTIEVADLQEKKGRHSGKMWFQYDHQEYANHRGQLVAEAIHLSIRFERDTARERHDEGQGRYVGRELARYTPDAIKGIAGEYAREAPRGAEPLYWEDVDVGQYLPPVIKGPLRLSDIISYMMGSGGGPYVRGHKPDWDFRAEHPAAYITTSRGIPDNVEAVHYEQELAEAIATPGPYDYGPERHAWVSHMITNWMGDHGWMEHLRLQLRSVNVIGDTTRCGGQVTKKWTEDGKHLVEVDVWSRNQMGEVTGEGEVRVWLPARDADAPGPAVKLAYEPE